MRKIALAMATLALPLFAWMFRYDVSGQISFGDRSRPVVLDRWTGAMRVYYPAFEQLPAEMREPLHP